jgi:hypothetical protein
VQNIYYRLAQNVYPEVQKKAGQGDVQARTWLEHFTTLGEKLRVQR